MEYKYLQQTDATPNNQYNHTKSTHKLHGLELYGHFEGELLLENHATNKNSVCLKDEFSYRDHHNYKWRAHIGDVIDGSSIPDILWQIYGSPLQSNYINALVIFESACNRRYTSWEATHEMFFYALLDTGIAEIDAKIMYAAVYYFGQHWQSKLELHGIYFNVLRQANFTQMNFFALKTAIEENNLSLHDINTYESKDEFA
jgi:Protein of unknown function (DUF1353)